MKLARGILITFEGIDGSGKSTLARAVAAHMSAHEYPSVLTREPGATALGQKIRTMVQDKAVLRTPQAEYLLFAADRAQHIHEVVKPALQENKLVFSDRMADSSVAYQGYGRGIDIEKIQMINSWVLQGIQPDIVFYLRISAHDAYKRIAARNQQLTAFEEKKEFMMRVVKGFDTLFKDRTDVITLDATHDEETLTTQTTNEIFTWLKNHNLLQRSTIA